MTRSKSYAASSPKRKSYSFFQNNIFAKYFLHFSVTTIQANTKLNHSNRLPQSKSIFSKFHDQASFKQTRVSVSEPKRSLKVDLHVQSQIIEQQSTDSTKSKRVSLPPPPVALANVALRLMYHYTISKRFYRGRGIRTQFLATNDHCASYCGLLWS